jgi:hypothetical protein
MSNCADALQLAEHFGALDVALLEAALVKHERTAEASDDVSEAIARCRKVMDRVAGGPAAESRALLAGLSSGTP